MRNIIDKRNFKRLKINTFFIEYKVKSSGSIYSAEVINISAGGMCFLRSSILSKNEIIQVKFPFQTKKIILTGEIIRIEGREVAIKFLDEESQIEKFVEYFNVEFLGVKAKAEKLKPADVISEPGDDTVKENLDNFFDDMEK